MICYLHNLESLHEPKSRGDVSGLLADCSPEACSSKQSHGMSRIGTSSDFHGSRKMMLHTWKLLVYLQMQKSQICEELGGNITR